MGEQQDRQEGERQRRVGCRNQVDFTTQSDAVCRFPAAALGARNLVPAPDRAVAGGVSRSDGPADLGPQTMFLLLAWYRPNPVLDSNTTTPQSSVLGWLWPPSASTVKFVQV